MERRGGQSTGGGDGEKGGEVRGGEYPGEAERGQSPEIDGDTGRGRLLEATSQAILCPSPRQERWHRSKRSEGQQKQGDPTRAARASCKEGPSPVRRGSAGERRECQGENEAARGL